MLKKKGECEHFFVQIEKWKWSQPNGCGRREHWLAVKKACIKCGKKEASPHEKFLGYS